MTIVRALRKLSLLAAALLLPAAMLAAGCPPPVPPATGAPAVDRGFLWTLQRDGRTTWLYGTLHVGKADWVQPGPRVAGALTASQVLALEIDPGDPTVQAGLARPDAPPPAPLPAALQARLQRQVQAACLPPAALAALHPALQLVMLSVLDARWAGLDPAYAQEQVLAGQARSAGRRVVALESVALQTRALMPEDDADTVRMLDDGLAQLESGRGRTAAERLARAWEQGDLQTLADPATWCDCVPTAADQAALRRLNDERNPHLATRIEALHDEGRPVFAAVGALHMTGPQGLPGLLAARGFRVERVAFGR